MGKLKVRVENGRIVGEAPPGFEEGAELEVSLVDPGDDMTPEELAELNRGLEAAWRAVVEGRVRPAEDFISEIRSER